MIAQGIIFIWAGTIATIPSGWQRVTTLDGRHIKATSAGVNPNVTGGSNTHSHTTPAHNHTMVNHTHSGQSTRDSDFETHGGADHNVARDSHYHDYTSDATQGGSLSDAITYASTNHEPPYYSPVFIEPISPQVSFSNGIIALWSSTTAPSGFTFCDGGGGTPDLRNKYLKGAATGADAGATGGSLTHGHTLDHTHSGVTHTHTGTSGWDSDQSERQKDTWAGGGPACDHHTHTFTLNANSAEGSSAYSGSMTSGTVEPSYKKLAPVKNTSGGARQVIGMIGLWLGSLSSIPRGWFLCDGSRGTPDMRGYFLKCANTLAEVGTIGGANTHTHDSSNSHTHSATGSHTHPSGSFSEMAATGTTVGSPDGVARSHSHTMSTCGNNTSSWNSATLMAYSSSNEPAFTTVAFIMYGFSKVGASQII
jgi:hypothetical protein